MENKKVEKLLNKIKFKLESYYEFKKAYNKQLAFDFNILKFFKVGENKVTEILAYFLDKSESHGQRDAFFKLFLENFSFENKEYKNIEIKCQKRIDNKRRIDLYIKLDDYIIAIENKIWAKDQKNQLSDYSDYLSKRFNDNYTLFYLNPYGKNPSENSIKDEDLYKKNIKVISYTKNILPLLDKWIAICKAPNVRFFLEQFRIYLEVKFLGNKNINMINSLENLVKTHYEETVEIVNTFEKIHTQLTIRIKKIGKKIEDIFNTDEQNLKIETEHYAYEKHQKFRFKIYNNNEFVKIILQRKGFELEILTQINEQYKIKQIINNKNIPLEECTDDKIIELFIAEVQETVKIINQN